MIRLIKVELTRLLWRRAVVVLLILGVLTTAAVFAIRFYDTRPQSIDDLASDYGSQVYDQVDRCVSRGNYQGNPAATRGECEQLVSDNFNYHPSLDMDTERQEGSAAAVMLLVGLLMLLIGTTFAGHDWNTGSISNQLLFEPRRGRVWAAKAVAVGLVGAVVSLVTGAVFWSAIWATVAARDLPIRHHALQLGYEQVLWGVGFGAACAVFGYALTMLLRSTVGSIGLLFATMFLAVVTYGVLGFDGNLERFMPWGNFLAYASGKYSFFFSSGDCYSYGDGCSSASHVITRGASIVYFGLLLLLVALPSVLTFRERDLP